VSDPIKAMSAAEFATLLSARILTDEEIVQWVQTHSPKVDDKLLVLRAIVAVKGKGEVRGPLRTALRAWEGLPPLPGD
jgi:hypothetical protein